MGCGHEFIEANEAPLHLPTPLYKKFYDVTGREIRLSACLLHCVSCRQTISGSVLSCQRCGWWSGNWERQRFLLLSLKNAIRGRADNGFAGYGRVTTQTRSGFSASTWWAHMRWQMVVLIFSMPSMLVILANARKLGDRLIGCGK